MEIFYLSKQQLIIENLAGFVDPYIIDTYVNS